MAEQTDHELAQVNVSIARAPLDDPVMRGFVFAFDRVARAAAASPGFVWHLRPDEGQETVREGAHLLVVNVSVWRDYPSLHAYVYRSDHGQLLPRRGKWFLPGAQPSTALWWVDAGTRPTVPQALARLAHLRAHGSTPTAFSLLQQFDSAGRRVRRGAAGGEAGGKVRGEVDGEVDRGDRPHGLR